MQTASVLRTAINEVLFASDGAQVEIAAWRPVICTLDGVAELLSDIQARDMAEEIGKRTDEARRALAQLRSVYDISQALSASLDEERTFTTLVQKLGSALHAQHCALWLNDMGSLRVAAAHCHATDRPAAALSDIALDAGDDHPLNAVFCSGKPMVLTRGQGTQPVEEQFLDHLALDALLLVPLTVQEIPVGVVTLGRESEKQPFDATEVVLVDSAVNQTAIALQNAGLYKEISALNRSLEGRVASRTQELAREKERVETLYAIGRELSASLDLDQVLEKTLRLISQAVGARHGSVMLLDRETGGLVYRARLGGTGPLPLGGKPTPFKPGVGVAGWVLKHRKPVLLDDAPRDERWIQLLPQNTLTRSLIAAPLMVGDDVHGVLLIADGRPSVFNESQLRLVVASARQVAQTISNAELYQYVLESADRLGRLLRNEQEERSKSQAILQSIADGVIVNDTQHKVIVFNSAAEEILGTHSAAIQGRDVRDLFDTFEGNGRTDALAALEAISASSTASAGHVVEMTLEIDHKVISAHMAPVVTETGESLGIVTALRDITREVEADRAKSEFVSTVSHELRTPLTSIKGYADLLHAGAVGEINTQQERFLGIIRNNADRLTALVNDLLDMDRMSTGRISLKMEPIDMVGIVQEVRDSLREQIESKGIRLETDLPDKPAEIMGDRARLLQIVTNLVNNAYKFTDEGWIRISLTVLGDALRMDVADSGIGISTLDQGRIFERFYRADTPIMEGRGGTGLGLAITKQLVELHGGRVWVKSELDVGSTFTIIVPAGPHELPQSLLDELPAGAKKILVVDDERDIVALLRHHLGSQGYNVVTAATGEQAIVKAIEQQPDLITLDILLPDRHGFDVLRELKSIPETEHIPVIVLSVIQDESSTYELGAVDCIVKPLDEGQLLDSVARTLNHKGKILIAEDTPHAARMLTEILKRHGYDTVIATDGYETLTLARRERPGLILLDLRMPGMDGYEALTRLKRDRETKGIPILVMSAHAVDAKQERLRVQSMGAEDFLPKPFGVEELLGEIDRVAFSSRESGEPCPSVASREARADEWRLSQDDRVE
jgi:PAS domain S-box-containing protein